MLIDNVRKGNNQWGTRNKKANFVQRGDETGGNK